ncbi:MAG: site-specific DNA-methyltransferase [Candidatus Marinimicrobia bacterium]|nr:site-specific DNA-methyltransferase [Candidatus Neomarinimicrobiota bacterium]
MDGNSLNIIEDKLNKLKEILPETFTEEKIDWEKLKAALGEDIEFREERYHLNWADKSEAFRILQQPTTATLVPDKEESVNFNNTENLFIEGENLEALKVMQKSYFGKIKMVYIDPPYNTGNDLIYSDKFAESREDYLKRTGTKDENGMITREGLFRNSKDSGHYHSNWLSMMYPRLFLARNLLREDGVIFVSIDDNEVHNLRLLMNEVFGEENFAGLIVWKNKYGAGAKTKGFIEVHEYILCYGKNELIDIESELTKEQIEEYDKNKDEKYNVRGGFVTQPLMTNSLDDRKHLQYTIEYNGEKICPRKQWVWEKKRLLESIKNNEVVFKRKNDGQFSVRAKIYLKDENGNIRKGKPLSLLNGPFNQEGTKETEQILGKNIFNFPKPNSLIKYLFGFTINNAEDKEGIYLDFFSGSCTTAHAVLDLNKKDGGNRKFIMVQMPERCDEKSEAYKAGYKTIAEIGKERIRRVIKKIQKEDDGKLDFAKSGQDLGFKVFKLRPSNFKIWCSDQIESEEELLRQMEIHADPVAKDAEIEDILYELLLKSGKELTSEIEYKDGIYRINKKEIAIVLEKIDEDIMKVVITGKPEKLIMLDRLFQNNDQFKTNTLLQMKDAGIEFKVV